MINCLYDKFKCWSENGSIYILSDTHFNDEDCIKMSPDWITPDEQLKIINKLVHKNDTFIHLGDVGNVEHIKKIKGYKVLLMGNHDTGSTNFKRKVERKRFDKDEYSKEKALCKMKELYPNCKYSITEGYNFHSPFEYWEISADNCLFDEVYEGPLMISEKILLSHEPIPNLEWCLNIHGHDHSGGFCKDIYHLNLAANVCQFTPISLGEYIKTVGLRCIKSIHRDTIDRATERKNKRTKKNSILGEER